MKKIYLLLIFSMNTFALPFSTCDEGSGQTGIYPCKKIDLLQRVDIASLGGLDEGRGSDVWGWTDPETGREYALMGLSSATSFVDITDPKAPVVIGNLSTETAVSSWRDIKTYKNHAFIVSEAKEHGMQIFDLTQLRNVVNLPVTFEPTANYNGFGRAHNIIINEDTGYAYAAGTTDCGGGLHMVDIKNPTNPTFAGCFSEDGYTHDAHCVSYIGPDPDYQGKEICANSNEDTLTIVDVSNKSNPVLVSKSIYETSQYTHQAWFTEDHRYILLSDELDERRLGQKTRTYIWDMMDLDIPQLVGFYSGPTNSIDHNIYIKGQFAYLTNYTSGLRIVDISNIATGDLEEVAYFDSYPENDDAIFNGAWSNYPFFDSGNVILSDLKRGLFVLEPKLCPMSMVTEGLTAEANGDNSIKLDWNLDLNDGESYNVYRSDGGCDVDNFEKIDENIAVNSYTDNAVSGQVKIGYKINKFSPFEAAVCESEMSICVEVETTGTCTARPLFSGVNSVESSDTDTCGVDIKWSQADSYCGSGLKYDVYKSTDYKFVAEASNKIASGITTLEWHDFDVTDRQSYYYLVRAIDADSGKQDNNLMKKLTSVKGEKINATFSTGAEVGDAGFLQGNNPEWDSSESRAKSGERSFWSQDNDRSCNSLTFSSLELTPGMQSELSFWSLYDAESGYDGGVVEISSDSNQWNQLALDYPGKFLDAAIGNACGYEVNTPSFTGKDLTWKKHTVDLSSYQGQDVSIRFNYSSDNIVTLEGWYLDDISVTNTQGFSQCTTKVLPDKPQLGLYYDRARSGHGFVIEPIANTDLYFTVFYTYKDDGTPEWYTSLTALENNVLNINQDDNTLQRFIHDFSIDSTGSGNPNILDASVGRNSLKIDFNSDVANASSACNDGTDNRSNSTALATWQLGDEEDQWCIEPLINKNSYPSPDFGGTWWTGIDDKGWGLSLSFAGDLIVVTIYYFDAEGIPRWAQGTKPGFQIGQEITLDMLEFTGFARTALPPEELESSIAGSISLTLNNNSGNASDGLISVNINYQGSQGGSWVRSSVPIILFTEPH